MKRASLASVVNEQPPSSLAGNVAVDARLPAAVRVVRVGARVAGTLSLPADAGSVRRPGL